jgi:TonB family protein
MLAAAAIVALAAAGAGTWYWQEYLRWFRAPELERVAEPTSFITPDFPAPHSRQGYLGELRIDVYIDAQGAVDHVEVLDTTLPPVYGERATDAFMHAKFEPARRHGHAVRSVKSLQLDIEPPGAAPGEAGGSSRSAPR